MLKETSTSDKAVVEDTGVPTTGGGYDPIVGTPPPPDPGPTGDEEGTTTYTPTSVSITSLVPTTTGAGSTKDVKKSKGFYIVINSLTQYFDDQGQWIVAQPNDSPFDVDNSIVNQPREHVKRDEQFVIATPINTSYFGPLPGKLVIEFTLSDNDGDNPVTSSYSVIRPA